MVMVHSKMNILKNVGNQTVDGSHWLPNVFLTMKVNVYPQLNFIETGLKQLKSVHDDMTELSFLGERSR